MSASDRFPTVETLLENESSIVEAGSDSKKKGEFWLRVYKSTKEGSAKLPYDQSLDQMPILKGNSDFARKNNKFLRDLFLLAKNNLKPGEEKELHLTVKIYRASETSDNFEDVDDDDELNFI